MRGDGRYPWWWATRPQSWVLLAACLITLLGVWLSVLLPVRAVVLDSSKQVAQVLHGSVAPGLPMRPECSTQPCLALTFDDGPDPHFTPAILDTLERHNVRATFFVTGLHAERHPDLVRREFLAGHEVGNHSWSHPDFTWLQPEQMEAEVSNTQRVIMAAGVPAPTLFRPPYGAVNDVVLAHVPLTIVRWNIDPEDWKVQRPENIIEHTGQFVHPGGMVLLHDTEQHTAEALDGLLQQLQGQYHFVTVSELLNLPAGQRGQYFGR